MNYLRKYNTTLSSGTAGSDLVRLSIRLPDGSAFATSSDWTPAAGDVKVSKDGGAQANIATLPSYSNGSWEFTLSGTELSAKTVRVVVTDAAVEPIDFTIETFGSASGMWPTDYGDSVRLGMTALPNAAAEAAGGLYTRGTGTGQVTYPTNFSLLLIDGTGLVTEANSAAIVARVATALPDYPPGDTNGLITFGTGTGQLSPADGLVQLTDVGVDAIWDEALSGHTTAGTAGKKLADASTLAASDVWAAGTRTLTAGTNIVLAKGTGITGFTDLDAAGVRSAVGMASANLDTQLAAIKSDTAAILDDTGTAGVVVASGSKTGYALAATGLNLVTAWTVNITGNLSGSVGSVTGAVGSVTGAVGSVTSPVSITGDAATAGTRFLTMISLDGAVYRYTANALELAPTGTGGGGGGTVLVSPVLAQVSSPAYVTRDMAPIYAGSAPVTAWTVTDSTGAAVDLSAADLRYIVGEVDYADEADQDTLYSDEFAYGAAWSYESGSGIAVSGDDNNVVTVTQTGTDVVAGLYRYWLLNVTSKQVLATGTLRVRPIASGAWD